MFSLGWRSCPFSAITGGESGSSTCVSCPSNFWMKAGRKFMKRWPQSVVSQMPRRYASVQNK